MRFIIDENVPLLVALALRRLGHDCYIVAHAAPGISDEDVMAFARREQRILVTFDSDFARMIFHELQPPPPAVVHMQGRPEQALLVSRAFVAIFQDGSLDLDGRFLVIDPSGTIRSLPLRSDNG